MPDLLVYKPKHGYSDDDYVYVSWLDANYYISDKDIDSFKLATTSGGAVLVQFTETIAEGFVREAVVVSTTTITGLEHLEGEIVKVTSRGKVVGTEEVSGGSITVQSEVDTYVCGIGYNATLIPMDLDIEETGLSTTKRPNRVIVNMNESIGGKIGPDVNHLENIPTGSSLFTGHKEISIPGGYTRATDITIKQTMPLPMTVLSLTYDLGASRD